VPNIQGSIIFTEAMHAKVKTYASVLFYIVSQATDHKYTKTPEYVLSWRR